MLLKQVTEMSLKEKFQAVFTWKLKKPSFEVGENITPKERLNYEMLNREIRHYVFPSKI